MPDLLTIVLGVFDFGSIVFAAVRFWRISVGLLISASMMVAVCFFVSSPGVRWIVGFHVFALFMTAGIIWEQKRGRLHYDDGAASVKSAVKFG